MYKIMNLCDTSIGLNDRILFLPHKNIQLERASSSIAFEGLYIISSRTIIPYRLMFEKLAQYLFFGRWWLR